MSGLCGKELKVIYLFSLQIVPDGKADENGELQAGDYILTINDVKCTSVTEAVQLIESAFRTLTLLVWR